MLLRMIPVEVVATATLHDHDGANVVVELSNGAVEVTIQTGERLQGFGQMLLSVDVPSIGDGRTWGDWSLGAAHGILESDPAVALDLDVPDPIIEWVAATLAAWGPQISDLKAQLEQIAEDVADDAESHGHIDAPPRFIRCSCGAHA